VVKATDTAAPHLAVTRVRCTATRCVLDVALVDPAPSAGLGRLTATVRTRCRTTCGTGRQRRACTKTTMRTLAVTRTAAGRYRVVAARLRHGQQRFTLRARDLAGHQRSVTATRTT
jgi:hypothetical protein